MKHWLRWIGNSAAVALICGASAAFAQVKVGVVLSATGPAASLGIPEKNTIELLPKTIGGSSVQYIVLDDASDTTKAVQDTHKLIDEDHVDVIVGSTITPNSMAMLDVVSQAKTPMISMAASAHIVQPVDAKRSWAFKTPQNDSLMADAIAGYMKSHGVKTVGFIGFTDAYGESWHQAFLKAAQAHGLTLVSDERYVRTDTSVTGQVLKTMGVKPDAVLIAASGTPAALPAKELKSRGYAGKVYQTHGVANNDFLRVCGKGCEGELLPVGPIVVAEQLLDSNPVKKSALAYKTAYEAKYGAGSVVAFGGHAWDAGQMLQKAIPVALEKAQPGTEAFRVALRGALENLKDLPVSHGIMNMTAIDHNGFDKRARVIVQVTGGKWKVVGE
ncbi:ABC transporter substrate-binding protein [Trinickia sp. LjRoot230]|uniref:ABC transporter substrate-binding protein n=1 Tax=Trinickia sp. LjRoot230 TaxID=3342288 RepID=UPI003ECE39D3